MAGLAATAAAGVAQAGLATQLGAAVGVAAVTAAAVSTGTMVNPNQPPAAAPFAIPPANLSEIPSAMSPDDPWIPPMCLVPAITKQGSVELKIQSLSEDVILKHRIELQRLFREIYNNISGMCLDPMYRTMYYSTLEEWSITQHGPDRPIITTTYWSATVNCSGCPGE